MNFRTFPEAPLLLQAAAPGGTDSGDGKEAGKDVAWRCNRGRVKCSSETAILGMARLLLQLPAKRRKTDKNFPKQPFQTKSGTKYSTAMAADHQVEIYPRACFSCCSFDLAELVKPNNLLKTRVLLSAPAALPEAGAAEGIL